MAPKGMFSKERFYSYSFPLTYLITDFKDDFSGDLNLKHRPGFPLACLLF